MAQLPSVTAPPLGTTAPPPGLDVPPTPGKLGNSRSTIVAIVLVVMAVAVVGVTLFIKSFGATNSVSIPLTSAPPGATVTIDGVEQPGKTPLNAAVTVGEPHVIVFSAPGRKPTTKKIWPRAGVSSAVHAELAEQ